MQNENESPDADVNARDEATAAWDCKPLHGMPGRQEVSAAVQAASIILASAIMPYILPEGWIVDPEIAAQVIALLLFWPLYTIWKTLTRGRDCLHVGEGRIVRVREIGTRFEQLWTVREADVDAVIFKGGSFWRGDLKAAIHGRGFFVRMRRGNKTSDQKVSTLKVSNDVLVLHPRLLEWLIDLAEPKAATRKDQRAIRRARRFLPRAFEKTPDPLPLEDEALETQPQAVEEQPKPAQATAALLWYSALLAGFGFALFVHLRGSFYGFLLPLSVLLLLGSPYWLWPITARFETSAGKLAALYTLNGILVLIALFVWFLPALWFVVAAYLIFLLYCIAAVRFGPHAAGRIARWAILGCAVYVAAAVIYFGNWPVARLEPVLTIRYRLGSADIDPSPDGKRLAVAVADMIPRRDDDAPRFQPLRDSHLKLFQAVAHAAAFLATDGEYPKGKDNATSPATSVVFATTRGDSAAELLLPVDHIVWTRWSSNARRLAIFASKHGYGSQGEAPKVSQLWVAEPLLPSVQLLYEGGAFLAPPDDLWSSDSGTLRACFMGKNERGDVRAIIDTQDGHTEVRHVGPADDPATTPTWHRFPGWSADSIVSPNGRWRAVKEGSKERGRIVIQRHPEGEPVAAITFSGGAEPPYLSWSPDSRKLAVSRESRTWVHDLGTEETTAVKTWRRQHYRAAVWSPDSRAFYFARTLAMGMIGLEAVKVTLRD